MILTIQCDAQGEMDFSVGEIIPVQTLNDHDEPDGLTPVAMRVLSIVGRTVRLSDECEVGNA